MINRTPCCKKTEIAEISKTQEERGTITTRDKMYESMLDMRHLK